MEPRDRIETAIPPTPFQKHDSGQKCMDLLFLAALILKGI